MNIDDSTTPRTALPRATAGLAAAALVALAPVAAQAVISPECYPVANVTTLHAFAGNDGAGPAGRLYLASDGNYYGTTFGGGASGLGTVFRISPTGAFSLLHSFGGSDGQNPEGGLVQGNDGNLYGTTVNGGSSAGGTLFELTLAGAFSSRINFSGASGVSAPIGALVKAGSGELYGVTAGGDNAVNTGGWFSYSPPLGQATLYPQWFPPQVPVSGFSLGSGGNLYGSTYGYSGSGGTAYDISLAQGLIQLHAFPGTVFPTGSTDGQEPQGGLTVGSDGNLYGMTQDGGASGDGTIFKIDLLAFDPKYPETQLYSWSGGQAAPVGPDGAMTEGADGNFYGVTGTGQSNSGTIFEITPSGTYVDWYNFSGPDGSYPMAGLVQSASGTWFGTTYEGGANDAGTVFELAFGKKCMP
jgi:uncharacterized repeat protein (TIGR03803 family)